MEERVNIVYHPLPLSIRGFVTQTFDDNGEAFYTICLNTAFNAERNMKRLFFNGYSRLCHTKCHIAICQENILRLCTFSRQYH